MDKNKENFSASEKIKSIIGIILCIILTPILVINLTLIAKSYINKDEVPNVAGTLPLIVLTDSMYPEIQSGDLIICHTIDAEDVKKGDIISFFDPSGNGTSIVTHRVIEVIEEDGNINFKTRGDANNTDDKSLVSADSLVGIYDFRIPNAGNAAIFMQSSTGFVVCVIAPIALLIGYDTIRRNKNEKANKKDMEALLAELEELKAKSKNEE